MSLAIERRHVASYWLVLGAPALIAVAATAVLLEIRHEVVYVNDPVHAAVEMFGASVAFMLWLLLMLRQPDAPATPDRLWVALAFLAMGIFDGLHASTHFDATPNRFVLLHSFAVFAGGVLFALVWLPSRPVSQRSAWWVATGVAVAAITIGVLAISFPAATPRMVQAGAFTPLASVFNVGGGIGFLAASAYFMWRGLSQAEWEARILATLCLLFGAAGVLFDLSDPWDVVWWGWHGVRGLAYTGALVYFALVYYQQSRTLTITQQRLKTIVDSSAEGICGLDATGRATFVNPAVERMTGYRAAELVGRPHHDLLHHTHPDGTPYPSDDCPAHATLRDRKPRHVADDVFWRKDGTSFPVEYRVAPATDAGEALSVVLNFQDIGERKQAEAVAQRYAAIVEHSNDAIYSKALDGTILSWNVAAEQMFGYRADEVIGHSVSLLAPADRPDEISEILEKLGRGERTEHFETVRIRKNGYPIDISLTVSPIKDAAGKVIGASTIARDITARKKAEETIRQLNKTLENRASALEAANKELEAFTYSVSHDLRAPLRAVDGFARMVTEDYATRLDEEGRRQLGVIRDNAQKMGRLIDDLLSFSRMGRREMAFADIDMTATVRDVAEELRRPEVARTIEIAIAPLPPTHGDPAMLRQAWINLLSNAIKFTRPRQPARIEVGTREGANENVYCVKDNGVGFDMQYAGKLFGVFQRLHGPEEFEGTGVGLALVQRIVQRHGGRVWAEGRVNEGATFYFSLPRASQDTGGGT